MNVYEQIKDAKNNPSPGTLKFYKKNQNERVWAIGNDNESLAFVKSKGLRCNLRVGSPDFSSQSYSRYSGKSAGRSRSFTGVRLSNITTGQSTKRYCLVGMGKKNKGVWMVDVTELFISEFNRIGMCALHDQRHEFKLISPLRKKCIYCGGIYKKTIRIERHVDWSKV